MPNLILSPALLGLPASADATAEHLLRELPFLPIPVGAPGAGLIASMCASVLPELATHLRMPSAQFVRSMDAFRNLDAALLRTPVPPRVVGSHPEWALGLELARGAPSELRMLYVGELMIAACRRTGLPPRALRLKEALAQWRQSSTLPNWVASTLGELIHRMVEAFDRGALVAPEVRRRLFNERIALQLRQQVAVDDPARIRAVQRGQELRDDEIATALSALRAGIDQGDLRSLLVAAAYWIGILLDDMLDVPFDSRATDTLALLLPQGLVDVDLRLPLCELDQRHFPGTVPARRRLLRHLPLLLAEGLYVQRQAAGSERSYGDLLGQVQLRSWDPVPGLTEEFGGRITIARLIQSRTQFLMRRGVQPLAAGVATLRFDHLPKSIHPYSTTSDDDLWRAECTRAEIVGLGPLVPRARRTAVGSTTTPTDAQIVGALDYLQGNADALRPWRKASPDQVIRFHNAYALYMALAMSFFLGFRNFKVFPLLASMLGATHLTTIRHKLSSRKQVPELSVFPFVQVLMRRWMSHCESLDDRLTTLLRRHPDQKQLLAAKAHVDAVLARKPVTLLFTIGKRGIEPLGTAAVRGVLPPQWQLADDAGRHWLFDAVRTNGLSDLEAQYLLQHIVPGAELLCSDSTRSRIDLRARAAAAHQRAVMKLNISAQPGFSA